VAFSRAVAPAAPPGADDLTGAMVGIGMNFAATGAAEPNIEDTLLFASIEAMEKDDLRVLAVLVTWFGVHAAWVNADRLTQLVSDTRSPRVRALWSGRPLAVEGPPLRSVGKGYSGQPVDLLTAGTAFQMKRHGEDPRFAASPLRVPGNVLRDRGADVLAPEELAKRHRAYHRRVMFGPNYRADMWSVLEMAPTLSAAELARRTYGSFATARHVRRDFKLPSSAGRLSGRPCRGAERTT
jgi:hypothetical protein